MIPFANPLLADASVPNTTVVYNASNQNGPVSLANKGLLQGDLLLVATGGNPVLSSGNPLAAIDGGGYFRQRTLTNPDIAGTLSASNALGIVVYRGPYRVKKLGEYAVTAGPLSYPGITRDQQHSGLVLLYQDNGNGLTVSSPAGFTNPGFGLGGPSGPGQYDWIYHRLAPPNSEYVNGTPFTGSFPSSAFRLSICEMLSA